MKSVEKSRQYLKLASLIILALWITVAVLNNFTDPITNINNIENTVSMKLLKEDSLAEGLIWRAWPSSFAKPLFYTVCVIQAFISLMMWRAVFYFAKGLLSQNFTHAICCVNQALMIFICLWGGFLCGGLWFGYWIKQGAMQMVHMTLFILGVSIYLIFNQSQKDI